jgi:hypothetical protein
MNEEIKEKKCTKCGEIKNIEEFYRKTYRWGEIVFYGCGECKECRKKYREKNKERIREWNRNNPFCKKESAWRISNVDMNKEKYLAMLEKQNNRCVISGYEFVPGNNHYKCCVDHDHRYDSCNVRGLLCDKINRGLGRFFDNIEYLTSALNYLQKNIEGSEKIIYKECKCNSTIKKNGCNGQLSILGKIVKKMLLKEQKNKCPICGCEFVDGKFNNFSACLDHNHSTGFVRGMLCNNCNTGLGLFEDNIQFLRNAIMYLQAWQAKKDRVLSKFPQVV